MNRKYGWRPDVRAKAHLSVEKPPEALELPKSVDLRPELPEVWDQGQTSSCTGFGTSAAIAFQMRKEHDPDFEPSHKFPYYNGRVTEGDPDQDAGARIEDVVDSLTAVGYCSEKVCPSVDMCVPPSPEAYEEAKPFAEKVKRAVCSASTTGIKHQLAQGLCVIVGMMVYSQMESAEVARTGVVELPGPDEELLGGHCVLICGYTEDNYWIVRNSWGKGWGKDGYFLLNHSYPVSDATVLLSV